MIMALAAPAGRERGQTIGNHHPEFGAGRARGDELDLAAMGAGQLAGNDEAQPRAARPAGALECFEQMIARLLRDAWTIILDHDHDIGAAAVGGEAHAALLAWLLAQG